MIFSIVAIYKESWFRAAYISVEISYAVNTTIMWIFWIILWPIVTKMADDIVANAKKTGKEADIKTAEHTRTFMYWYQALLHAIPWISTVINLAITDMALNKSHWWIAVVALCPGYMLTNLWGSMTMGQR